MADATFEQVTRLADQLSSEEKCRLIAHLARQLQREGGDLASGAVGVMAKQPQSLYGIWRDHFPPDVDIDALLHEIRHEWEDELDEVTEQSTLTSRIHTLYSGT